MIFVNSHIKRKWQADTQVILSGMARKPQVSLRKRKRVLRSSRPNLLIEEKKEAGRTQKEKSKKILKMNVAEAYTIVKDLDTLTL